MQNNRFGNKTKRNFASPINPKEFGDFEEIKEDNKKPESTEKKSEQEEEPVRVRMPWEGQIVGIVRQRLGGNRMEVSCSDGKTRNCRVPGRFKRKFWLRPGDAVLIEPWPDDNNKADVVFQYKKGETAQLRRRGLLKGINEGF